jgi:hypothetical protein
MSGCNKLCMSVPQLPCREIRVSSRRGHAPLAVRLPASLGQWESENKDVKDVPGGSEILCRFDEQQ